MSRRGSAVCWPIGIVMQKIFAALLLLTFDPFSNQLLAQNNERYVKVANRLVSLVNKGDYATLQTMFNHEMGEALPLEKSTAFFQGMTQQRGNIMKLDAPRADGQWLLFPAHFERGTLDMRLALDDKNQIAGLFFKAHNDSRVVPNRNGTELTLPANGKWLVFWGGDTSKLNYHHDTPNQQFALDLLGVGPDGKTKRAEGEGNESYYAFGREVLAPAEGTVVAAIDGVPDNEPGSMNPYSALGNCVMIQHRSNEVSVLAHFKRGSVRVKAGDKVSRGQVLGLCGNSGNSSEPHLHYHLQDSPVVQDGLGIKCFFAKVTVLKDGKAFEKEEYSPVKRDIISRE